jgi:hypothetical protein
VSDLHPWARAVVVDGRLTLNCWTPFLMSGGPTRGLLAPLRDRGVVLADLSCWESGGREELIVEWVPEGAGSDEALATIEGWARTVGYVRVWSPGRVLDLGDAAFAGGRAVVECPTCGLAWDDDSADFWAVVRSNGCFPRRCLVCNASLPQWEVRCPATP